MADAITTPPHLPTYNVYLSKEYVHNILQAIFPNHKLEEFKELERGKSFNNRIYFIDLSPLYDGTGDRIELVLKVCGHYFGASKVQNEVGALLLLHQYCPSIPTPQTYAWSEDGKVVECLRNGKVEKVSNKQNAMQSRYGWVLISRLPGRIIQPADLDGPHCTALLQQLARHIFTWRTAIPDPARIGNLRIDTEATQPSLLDIEGKRFTVGGLILTNKYDPVAYHSWADYYRYQLQDKYDHLVTSPELAMLAQRITEQVSNFLPIVSRLPFLARRDIKFTHMDLSPRNILISETFHDASSPPTITGIIDWEFSAFLPSQMEWLNSLINQSDDWPEERYTAFLSHLSQLERQNSIEIDLPVLSPPSFGGSSASSPPSSSSSSVQKCLDSTTSCTCPYHTFKHLSTLEKAIEHVAPWWVTPTAYIGRQDELEVVCDNAATIVLDCLERLRMTLVR